MLVVFTFIIRALILILQLSYDVGVDKGVLLSLNILGFYNFLKARIFFLRTCTFLLYFCPDTTVFKSVLCQLFMTLYFFLDLGNL